MTIQLAATNRLHHRPPCSLSNEYWLFVYQITTKNIYCRRKCQNMQENMRYAHCAEKCGKVPSMRQSHIRVFLTCLCSGCVVLCESLMPWAVCVRPLVRRLFLVACVLLCRCVFVVHMYVPSRIDCSGLTFIGTTCTVAAQCCETGFT